MNWGTRAAWVRPGYGIDWAKVDAHHVAQLYVAANAANAAGLIRECWNRKPPMPVGIFEDPHWYLPPTYGPAAAFAKIVSDDIARLIPGRGNPVMVDVELLDVAWQAEFIAEYRRLRPQRETSITVAPFQAPVLALQAFADAGFHCYPQAYYGDMSPADAGAVVLEVVRACFPADRLHPFYDGARLPADARDGAVFTLERLP